MTTFFSSFFISTGILLVFSTPIFYVAWRKQSYKTRRFLIVAGATGLLTALLIYEVDRRAA